METLFEYYILSMQVKGILNRSAPVEDLSKSFNDLSKQGWVFVESQRIDIDGWTDKILFIFKRPLP